MEMGGGSSKNLQSSSPFNQVKHFGKFPVVTPSTIMLQGVISPNLSKKCNKFRTTSYIKNLSTDLRNLCTSTLFWEIWSISGKSQSNSSQKDA